MAESTVKIVFLGDSSKLKGELDGLDSKVDKSGSVFDGFGKKAALGLGAGGVAAGAAFVHFGQMGNALDAMGKKAATVFEGSKRDIDAWADSNAKAFGLTDDQLTGLAANFGDLLKPMGFTAEQAAGMSKDVVGLSGALSAWSGGTTSAAEASDILAKAMLGETDGLKSLGIAISAADIEARLAAKGQKELTGAALAQAKAVATQELIFEKSTDAQKAWSDGSMDAIKSQNSVKSSLAELQEQIASRLQPAFAAMTAFITERIIPAFGFIADNIAPIATGLAVLAGGILGVVVPAFIAWASAAIAAAAAQIAAAAPAIALGVAIAALAAGIVYAYQNFEGFRTVVDAVAGFVTGTVVPAFASLVGFLSDRLVPAFAAVVGFVRDPLVPILTSIVTTVAAIAVDVGAKVAEIVGFFVGLGVGIANVVAEVVGTLAGWVGRVVGVGLEVQRVLFDIFGYFVGLATGIAKFVADVGTTLAGWVLDVWKLGGQVLDFFREIPGKLGDFFVGLAETIISPFRSAFNAIAGLWNRTVGSLSFSIPSWVPGIGGNGWDVPDIPTFHTGGIVPGTGDVLSLLKGGEGVFTREQMAALGGRGAQVINVGPFVFNAPVTSADANHIGDTVQRTLMSNQLRVALAGA